METVPDILAGEFGGHQFRSTSQSILPENHRWPECIHCHGRVSWWEIGEGLWPARLGRWCPAILFSTPNEGETPNGHPENQD